MARKIRLHLGCGTDHRKGWVNVDANPKCRPDLVSSADRLSKVKSSSVDVIEACHLFEHFTYLQAIRAIREWYRILKSGGALLLELPDFDKCIKIIGKYKDPKGYDMGMIGIFGHPPMVEKDGLFQAHKWGWTFDSLSHLLRYVGFTGISKIPITQTWRLAAKMKTGRDMRIRCTKK